MSTHAIPAPSHGVVAALAQADAVGIGVFLLLVLMSLVSWYLVVARSLSHRRLRLQAARTPELFWQAASLQAARNPMEACAGEGDPFARLALNATDAARTHAIAAAPAAGGCSLSEFLTRALRRSIQSTMREVESGQAILASIGSTAPFVGLFGTVWGIYHALLAIGATGQASLDRVAGPVGEALIMTALGIAVAVPALLGYNALLRSGRALQGELEGFAHDLHARLALGAPAMASTPTGSTTPGSAAAGVR
jgi:biopolymer transport protein ExbB